jgi:hypothetical protein
MMNKVQRRNTIVNDTIFTYYAIQYRLVGLKCYEIQQTYEIEKNRYIPHPLYP